jgi:hypothetical protein
VDKAVSTTNGEGRPRDSGTSGVDGKDAGDGNGLFSTNRKGRSKDSGSDGEGISTRRGGGVGPRVSGTSVVIGSHSNRVSAGSGGGVGPRSKASVVNGKDAGKSKEDSEDSGGSVGP